MSNLPRLGTLEGNAIVYVTGGLATEWLARKSLLILRLKPKSKRRRLLRFLSRHALKVFVIVGSGVTFIQTVGLNSICIALENAVLGNLAANPADYIFIEGKKVFLNKLYLSKFTIKDLVLMLQDRTISAKDKVTLSKFVLNEHLELNSYNDKVKLVILVILALFKFSISVSEVAG